MGTSGAVHIDGRGNAVKFYVGDGAAIAKNTLMFLDDPRTCSGAVTGTTPQPFAGVAADEKVVSDGSTTLGGYRDGRWDIENVGGTVALGETVCMSGAYAISGCHSTDVMPGVIVGTSMETISEGEVGAIDIGRT